MKKNEIILLVSFLSLFVFFVPFCETYNTEKEKKKRKRTGAR